jgi:hypothetical protein
MVVGKTMHLKSHRAFADERLRPAGTLFMPLAISGETEPE